MGAGIAQVAAAAGCSVILHDREERFIERGLEAIRASLNRSVERGRMSEEKRGKTLSHINGETNLKNFNVDFAIEAATENLAVKRDLFRELDNATPAEAILATNTSSISITTLGAVTSRPEKIIGMHFMNPVPVMALVEIIRGIATSQQTFDATKALAEHLGKTPVEVRDFPGFVSNRVLMPMINEAIYALFEGVGSAEAIDTVMKLGMNHPMGPLQLADFIGLDTCLSIMEVLHDGFGDSKYRPCPLLKQYVAAGWYGKKSGRGFYSY
ncbi:MAG: 3-hydroxybutyryl-CoA dehydrogenase [Candidatus Eremiobacteraeota bacterium]|nr:3-hydroxybutyryl-CoA dehydrogenase [Candidatus Eremiobacteraeota bacterium]MDQ6933360.1 3-hydroxybutyryl-CoA dehydrogenase [Candidatus Eremiobacteraeota bacterium]